jgi:hypothetical protein
MLTHLNCRGTTYTGHYEDVKATNDLLVKKGLDIPIHVDAASGGFVAPFMAPELEWDFRLEKVSSGFSQPNGKLTHQKGCLYQRLRA